MRLIKFSKEYIYKYKLLFDLFIATVIFTMHIPQKQSTRSA